jgi:phage-related tail fiber protein
MIVGQAPRPHSGPGLVDADWLSAVASMNNIPNQQVVAHAGGGQASATPINPQAGLVNLATVVTNGDSVQVPQATVGQSFVVFNSTAQSANFYANPATNKVTNALDTINGSANANAYSLANGKSALFFCPVDGAWAVLLSA